MKPSSLYGHLAELIAAVSGSIAPADAIVRKFFRDRHYIGSKERRWLSTRIFGVIRHRRLLEYLTNASLQLDTAGCTALCPRWRLPRRMPRSSQPRAPKRSLQDLDERWTESVPGHNHRRSSLMLWRSIFVSCVNPPRRRSNLRCSTPSPINRSVNGWNGSVSRKRKDCFQH